MAARAGFKPTTLWTKGANSTNAPPRPTYCFRISIISYWQALVYMSSYQYPVQIGLYARLKRNALVSVTELCGIFQCDLECEYGHSRGPDGCLQCQCNDPCEVTDQMSTLSHTFICTVIKKITYAVSPSFH